MGKFVATGSFWLGAVLVALALLTRGLNILGLDFLGFQTKGASLGYHTYMDAAILFLVISIAATNYARLESRQP